MDNDFQLSEKSDIIMQVETDEQGRTLYFTKEIMETKKKLAKLIAEKQAKAESESSQEDK